MVGTCCGDKGKSANKEGRVQAKTNAGGVGVTQPQETAPVTPPGMPEKHGHRRESEQIEFMFGIYFIKLRLKRAIGPDFCCLEKIARLVAGECGRAIESEGAAREESAPSEKLLEGAESGGGSRRAPVARRGDALFPAPRESDGARSTCSDLATRSTGPR